MVGRRSLSLLHQAGDDDDDDDDDDDNHDADDDDSSGDGDDVFSYWGEKCTIYACR